MKHTKKILSIMLALVLALAMTMPVMAADAAGTYSITITNDKTGHVYKAYQIFAGDVKDTTLSNVKWGSNMQDTTKQAALLDAYEVENLKALLDRIENAADAERFSKNVADLVTGEAAGTSIWQEAEKSYVISGLKGGYYLVVDETKETTLGESDAYSAYIVQVLGDETMKPKMDVPTFEKSVQEKNDSIGEEPKWQDAADYDIGDDVPFQLNAKLPSDATNFDFYETYTFIFHDDMSDGLSFNDDVVVKVGETEVDKTLYSVVKEGLEDGCEFHVKISDVKKIPGIKAGDVITVEFTAKLTGESVVIGPDGNPNTAQLEYSNNPNGNGEGTGKTPKDKVTVFTFENDIDKINENKEPLKGAEFTLYKWIEGDIPADLPVEEWKVADNNEWKKPESAEKGYWKVIQATVLEDGTRFQFKGLDSGIYKLVETKTPEGYNTAAPIDFTIEAIYDTNSENPQLTDLKVTPPEANFTANPTTGIIDSDIVNEKGTTLPETGGIGTTIFYVVGAILVIGAGILLVAKKRSGR